MRVKTRPNGREAGPNFFKEVNSLKVPPRTIKRFANRGLKGLREIFSPARNSSYKAEELAKALIKTCIGNSSAERCLKPSPDTILRRLHQVDEGALGQVIRKSNAELLKKLQLPRRVILAIDCRDLPYYGVEQPGLVRAKLPGTRLGVRFAMLSIVERGRTFTLMTKQVGQCGPRVEILEEMLEAIRGLVDPRMILMDRGFFTVEVIKTLKSRRIHFLMPAKRTAPIERLREGFERSEVPPVVDHTMRGAGGSVRVKLIFVRRKTEKGEETHIFVSDMAFEPEVASELYYCRWRIETNNRELKKFKAQTTSTSMKLRRAYYSLAALFYNLWISLRNILGQLRSHEFKSILHFQLDDASTMPIELGPGPPL